MAEAEEILRRVRQWGRARNALRAALGATAAVLAAGLVGRAAGVSLPQEVWAGVPALAVAGWGWPFYWERFLLRGGRRLGVGERLAAVSVLTRHGTAALLGPLVEEIRGTRLRMWRLVAGPLELGASAVAVGLAFAVVFFPVRTWAPVAPLVPGPDAVLETLAAPEPTAAPAPDPEPPDAVPTFPAHADLPGHSPYLDLLAAVLGLDEALASGLQGEELAERLATEEGLLRQLAERLAEIAPGGLSASERAELAPLAREVARADLRERLGQLLDRDDEAAAREAARAVAAVVEAADRVGERDDPDPRTAGAPGAGDATDQRPALMDAPDTDLMQPNGDLIANGDDPRADGTARSDVAGTGAGEPLGTGTGDWAPAGGEGTPVATAPTEGPMRAYIVRGVPGEPPAGPGVVPASLSPQDVEVVLRAREIPAELRDLVRRYFELIGENP